MNRFVEGEDRTQSTLFPERLDDYVSEDNPVRVIEAFVDELDLLVAIDGSKFKAANNRDKNFTRAQMKRRMEQVEQSIARQAPLYFNNLFI